MDKKILIVAAVVGVGAVFYARQAIADQTLAIAENEGGIMEKISSAISNLTTNPEEALQHPNAKAFLQLIRTGEGTLGNRGYTTIFGGSQFVSFADHPRIFIPFGTTKSSAAGAYQILSRTWDEYKGDLPDFSPASQDIVAMRLIKRRGALGDVLAGRFATAIKKCNKEWASLPLSPYGQPTLTMNKAATVLAQYGGESSEVIA